jgi:hypothetical protein
MNADANELTYRAIARNLRDFGYPDVTPSMIQDTHAALMDGEDLPHGIIGMFAEGQLRDAGLVV